MFSGIGLIASRDRRFERAREADAVAGEAAVARASVEQHRDARVDRGVHAMAEAGQPPLRRPASSTIARGDRVERQAVAPRVGRDRPQSAPCSRIPRRRARRRSPGRRRRSPPTATGGCPTPRAAPPRTTARRRRGRRRRSGSRRAAAAPPADGSRSWCSRKIRSVNVACRIRSRTSCPRTRMWSGPASTMAVRHVSIQVVGCYVRAGPGARVVTVTAR